MATERGTAIVRGASGGIGAATARALAQEGYPVVACAGRTERLAALAAESDLIEAWHLDVTDQSSVEALVEHLQGRRGTVLVGTVRTIKSFLPLLRASGDARGDHGLDRRSHRLRERWQLCGGEARGDRHRRHGLRRPAVHDLRDQDAAVGLVLRARGLREHLRLQLSQSWEGGPVIAPGPLPMTPARVAQSGSGTGSPPPMLSASLMMVAGVHFEERLLLGGQVGDR